MTKQSAWRADNFCQPLTIAGEIGLCLRPDQLDRGPAYSLYGVQVPRGTAGLPSALSHRKVRVGLSPI
jgi:hypothetical protein